MPTYCINVAIIIMQENIYLFNEIEMSFVTNAVYRKS